MVRQNECGSRERMRRIEAESWLAGGLFRACLAAAALFGATTPAAKVLLAALGPFTAAGLLYIGAGLAAWPWAITRRAAGPRANAAQRRRLAGAVIAGGGVAP